MLKFYYIYIKIMNYNNLTDEQAKEIFEDNEADYYIDLYKSEY